MNEKHDLTEYVDKLYTVALGKVGDTHVAEDIVQETFLAALQTLAKGKEIENVWSWLLAILSNKHCDWLREKYNKPQISFEEYPFDIPEEEAESDDTSEKLEVIRRELGYLAQMHREVMVRFYMRGEYLEKIARDLNIPVGTVKSRLNAGRTQVKKGVNTMENYTKQSYDPDTLMISCSGMQGFNYEPFSLVKANDKLTPSILILAYEKPISTTELAKALGVPAVFVEPIVEKMVKGELMKYTSGGLVYTDFIIYTEKDRQATIQKQLNVADKHFELFWREAEQALSELRAKEYYCRQSSHAKMKLEMHFSVKMLLNAHIRVRNEVTGIMPYSEYPYRKDGGRWLAMGQKYSSAKNPEEEPSRIYGISGEAGIDLKNVRDAKYLDLRKYDTSLGYYPNEYYEKEYIKWIYELYCNVPTEESQVGDHVFAAVDSFLKNGILKQENGLALDIPVLTQDEYRDECKLADEYEGKISKDVREVLLPVFESGAVKLPAHLKSVPKWMQYMYCGDSVPFAVILKAKENGLLFEGVDYPIPASVLVVGK